MRFLSVFAAALLFAPVSQARTEAPIELWDASAIVRFSPDGGCTKAVVDTLVKAKTSVLVQAYSFTSAPIAKALADARKRGVEVRAILDDSNVTGKYSAADHLYRAGIPVFIDSAHAIAHNKVIVIDEKVVITGSFNFTRAAEEKNAENLLILFSPALAAKYVENWKLHCSHSEKYSGLKP